jgi:signal peptidase II
MPDGTDGGGDELQDATTRSTSRPTAASERVTGSRPRWAIFLGLAALVIVVDQLTKAWIVANVDPARPLQLVGDLVQLVFSRNTGALFGLFRDNATLFATVSIAVIGAIAWYHARAGRSALLSTALGLLLGGAIGNLLDRLRLGYVVDFVDAGLGDLRFYTFNVADAAISTALLLLVLVTLWPALLGDAAPRPPERATHATAGDDADG